MTPNAGFDEVDGLAGGASLDFSGSDEVEVEYCVQVRSAEVSADDTIQLRVKGLDTYTNTPTITAALALDQDTFRARNDNGDETTATWKAAANINWTQKVDENIRVRFVIQEANGSNAPDMTFQLEYNLNSGGWNDVTGALHRWCAQLGFAQSSADGTRHHPAGRLRDPFVTQQCRL